jgi:membrane associated rhomboid family serine protease
MGIYDRDYYRRDGPSFLGSLTERGRVCKWLIALNVVAFLVQLATAERLPGFGPIDGSFTQALWLAPDQVVFHGEVWRLLTHAFLHDIQDPWHILFNMFLLWWAGTQVEERYGGREFLVFYLTAALVGGIVYTATTLGQHRVAVGASGAVTAVLVVFACHDPYRTLLLFMVIPVPAWLLVVGSVGYDFFVFASQTESKVAVTAHLGGALFGFLYFKWHWHLSGLWPDFKAWRKRRARPKLRIYREEEPQAPVAVGAPADNDMEHLKAKVDAVLEKMSQVGEENLTESERQFLLRASEIYRRRRT